jgi:hypothetical protein
MPNAGFISAVHLFASLAIIELSRNAQATIRVQKESAAYAQLTHRHSWGWTHRHFGPGPLRAINTNPQQVSIMSFMHLKSSNCAVFRVRGCKHGKRTSADGPRGDRGWRGGKRDSPARGEGQSNIRRRRRVPRTKTRACTQGLTLNQGGGGRG